MKPEGSAAISAVTEAEDVHAKIVKLLKRARKHLKDACIDMEATDGDEAVVPEAPRLEFTVCGVKLFIDFAVDVAQAGGELDVRGSVVYGALRPRGRAQDLHEKRLSEFTISRHGLIEDPGGLPGNWHVSADAGDEEEEDAEAKALKALHYMMVERVLPMGAQWMRKLATADRG